MPVISLYLELWLYKMKQIAINLYNGCCGTLHANPGVHSPYNILDTPPSISANRIFKCITAHYYKISTRNIFSGFKEQAIMVIKLKTKKRYVIGRSNHAEKGNTSNYHANPYFGCVTMSRWTNRQPLIVEILPINNR